MNDIWIAPMSGIYPPTYVVMMNGKAIDYLTARPGHPKLTWAQEANIIAGYREWYDYEASQV